MELPFTESAFLDLFGLYNQAWWPLAIGGWRLACEPPCRRLANSPNCCGRCSPR